MNVDPYQAPKASIAWTNESNLSVSRVPLAAFILGTCAYHLFIWVLLRSTAVDRAAGTLLLINTPFFAMWGIAVWLGNRHSITFGVIVCCVQVAIAALTIVRDIGDWQATVLINTCILIAMAAIVAVSWRYRTAVFPPKSLSHHR